MDLGDLLIVLAGVGPLRSARLNWHGNMFWLSQSPWYDTGVRAIPTRRTRYGRCNLFRDWERHGIAQQQEASAMTGSCLGLRSLVSQRRIGAGTVSVAGCLLVAHLFYGQVIAQHPGDADPLSEGWTADGTPGDLR